MVHGPPLISFPVLDQARHRLLNPYDSLCMCAGSLRGASEGADAYDTHWLEHDRETILSARGYLGTTCGVQLEYRNEDAFTAWQLRPLAKAFEAAARTAMAEKHDDDAVSMSMDLLRLANVTRRGGLVTHLLLSLAFETSGHDLLRLMRRKWSSATCPSIIAGLEALEDERELYGTITYRDAVWESRVLVETAPRRPDSDLTGHQQGFSPDPERELLEKYFLTLLLQQRFHLDLRGLAVSRLLRCEAAIALERNHSGRVPTQIPVGWLRSPSSPLDPFTSRPFVYRVRDCSEYMLYSVGPTGLDHHGRFGTWQAVEEGHADFCIDYADYDGDEKSAPASQN